MLYVLKTQINAELNRITIRGLRHDANVSNRLTVKIFNEALFAWLTLKPTVENQFNTGCSRTIDVSGTDQLRHHLACWVKTLVLPLTVNTGDICREYRSRCLRRLMPREIHELLFTVAIQTRCKVRGRKIHQLCELDLATTAAKLLRINPESHNRCRNCQWRTSAIGDQSPVSRNFRRSHSTKVTLALKEISPILTCSDLKLNQTQNQHTKQTSK